MITYKESQSDELKRRIVLWWNGFHKNRPVYLIPITVLTGIYLAFELSFNARLLDVVGGTPTKLEVDSIEHWGRYISGIALALAIWGTVIMPQGTKLRWSISTWVLALGLSAFVSIYMVYNLEGDLIDNLTSRSDGATRQRALYLAALRHGILTGDVQVPTMNLTPETLTTPEGKTFAALFPVLAYSDNDIINKADKALVSLWASGGGARSAGAAQAFESYRRLMILYGVNLFNRIYAPVLDRLHDQLSEIPQRQAELWNGYVSHLPAGTTPDSVPAEMYEAIRSQVRGEGVEVSNDWRPNDRAQFYNTVESQTRTTAQIAFEAGTKPIRDELGSTAAIPEDLNWQTFFALPSVQARMRQQLGLPDSVTLPAGMNGETFERLIYFPMRKARVDKAMSCYRNAPPTFADGGAQQETGRRFMRLLLVPPIALAFSLIGAMVHITKFSNYSLRMFFNRRWLNIRTVGCAIAVVGLSAFAAPNAVTTSAGFQTLRAETHAALGPSFVYAFTWVIQAEHYAYPFDEAVRTHVLGGWTFGYTPGKHPESSPCAPEASSVQ